MPATFKEYLSTLQLGGTVQSYFCPEKFFKIFFVDTDNSRILLKISNKQVWFTEIDFMFGKLCA